MANWGEAGKGAAGGAMAGAALGSVVPGVGTLIGGAAGGILGGLGGLLSGESDTDKQKRRYEEYLNSIKNRTAPQLGPAQQAGYSQFRNNQANMISNLEAMAAGRGPSVAAEQLKAATDRNVAQQQALAQSGAGNPALAMMQAQNNAGRLGAQAAQDSAIGRQQEQLNAMQQLGLSIYGARGADESMNQYNTTAFNNRDEFNVGNQMNMYQLNDQARLQALSGLTGQNQPSFGDQMLAGGSMALGYGNFSNAAGKTAPASGTSPGGGNFLRQYYTPRGGR
jgi:phage tail tape-measure protein